MKPKCTRCKLSISEQELHVPGFGTFSVPAALAILTAKPRAAKSITGRKLANMLPGSVDEKHIGHVSASTFPGIILNTEGARFILDGNHRATKIHRAGGTFNYFQLTPGETAKVKTGK